MAWSTGPLHRWWLAHRTTTRPDAARHDDAAALLIRELGVAEPAVELPATLTRARLATWLADHEFGYFVDSEGTVGALWHGRVLSFLLLGAHEEILQVRAQWQREGALERLGEILEFCNEWNAERIWPKAYARVRDDGRISVVGEVSIDFEYGATDEQIAQTLHCGLSTAGLMFEALDERWPDPIGSAP